MIQIQNLTITDKTLTLDYRASNPFKDAIWVCYDTWVHGEQGVQDVTMRIDGDTVWIKLCFNLEPSGVLENPPTVAKYVRLRPGESCSGRILEDLPIRDYSREPRMGHKEHKEITLHRAVFEVGYFGPKWNKFFDSCYERIKQEPIESKPVVIGPYYYLAFDPFITEEILDSQLREVVYTRPRSRTEECAKVPIADVNIPCSVVVDDK